MNKQEAKRKACFQAALVIKSAIESGWEYADNMEEAGYTEADIERWEAGMDDLIDELFRRGRL